AAQPEETLREDALVSAGTLHHRRPARLAAIVTRGSPRSRVARLSHERFLARAARSRGIPQGGALVRSGRRSEERDRANLGTREDPAAPRCSAELRPPYLLPDKPQKISRIDFRCSVEAT